MRQMSIQRVEHELRGLRVTQAFRTHGHRLRFDFSNRGDNAANAPDYSLIVQGAAWKIKQRGQTVATHHAWQRIIDQTLPRFAGAQIKHASLGTSHTKIVFDKALQLELHAAANDHAGPSAHVTWDLLRNNQAILSLGTRPRAAG